MIQVTSPFLPPQEEYNGIINGIWERNWLTNNGPLVQQLEHKLEQYLNVPSLHFVTNGTTALQLAIKALNLTGEIITTPFSFVATTTSIVWENCKPVYVDICPETLCIDFNKIEEAITERTTAILATHVYGIPCDVEEIEKIAQKYKLKVIFDAAHAFGVQYKGKSLLQYGDVSTLSFHATKLFHTIEGGGIISNTTKEVDEKIRLFRSFGFNNDDYIYAGINGKNSEFHAAMGLCNLNHIESILHNRKVLSKLYDSLLPIEIQVIKEKENVELNYAYYPILLHSEKALQNVVQELLANKVQTRRYFYPSLNNLPYIQQKFNCPISEDISSRILCIPLYADLEKENVEKIAELINLALIKER